MEFTFWDWKEQIDIDEVNAIIALEFKKRPGVPRLIKIETGDDSYAVAITTDRRITAKIAQREYDHLKNYVEEPGS